MNYDFFGHEWGDFSMIFMSENQWQIASWVIKKIVIHINECIILFLTCHFVSCEHKIPLKQSLITHCVIVAKDSLFWHSIVMSPQLICDVMRTQGASIMTSYLLFVLAYANWHKGDRC